MCSIGAVVAPEYLEMKMTDATLIALGAALELAIASERQLLAALPELPGGALDDRMVNAVCGPVLAMVEMIEEIEAHTPEGRAVKARAAAFVQGDDREAA